MPRVTTVINWGQSVPDHFKFTFKLSKTITHAKGFEFNVGEIDLFMQTIAHVGDKKGCVLVQFPPGLKIEKFFQLKNFFTAIKSTNPANSWKIAIEFRNQSWYNEKVYGLLNKYNVSMVIHDLPASTTPLTASTGNSFICGFTVREVVIAEATQLIFYYCMHNI
jgi:uncharacterized protein YecE (DUF72 family)